MDITWYGHSCFRLSERGVATVVTDPYDYKHVGYNALKLKADIVTVSLDDPGHNHLSAVKGDPFVIDSPGEYEIGGVFITGISTNGNKRRNEDELHNKLYVIDYDGLTIAHLGELSRVPSQTEIEGLGSVKIVLVPVGGASNFNASKAAEVISLLEPRIVIPMHYATTDTIINLDPLSKFLKEMGITEVETLPSLKISNLSSLPEETHVVVLDYQQP